MKRWYDLSVVFITTLSLSRTVVGMDTSDNWPPLEVVQPFVGAMAKERLGRNPFNFDEDTIATLQDVNQLVYDIEPMDRCPLDDQKLCGQRQWVLVSRSYTFTALSVVEEIHRQVKSQAFSGCSFLNISSNPVVLTDSNAHFFGSWNGSNNACGKWPWGSRWSYSNGKAEGWWSLDIKLIRKERSPTLPSHFCIDIIPNYKVTDRKGLFGIWDPDTFIGGFLDAVTFRTPISPGKLIGDLFDAKQMHEVIRKFRKDLYSNIDSLHKTLTTTQQKTEKAFRSALTQLQALDTRYQYMPGRTLFEKEPSSGNKPASFAFRITEGAYLDRKYAPLAYRDLKRIRDLLEGLDQTEHFHEVKKNESYYSIAKDTYGDGALYHFLMYTNPPGNKRAWLTPGQRLRILPLIDYSLLAASGHIILPGESIWRKYEHASELDNWNPNSLTMPPLSPNIDTIYPLQIIGLPFRVEAQMISPPALNETKFKFCSDISQ